MKKTITFLLTFYFFVGLKAQLSFDPAPEYFRIQRALPLVSMNTTQDILVSNYGAIANDGLDDTQGITNAINAAKALSSVSNPVRVLFDANGAYDLHPATGSTHSISIRDVKYIVLDGQKAEIFIHNPQVGFMDLLRCENFIVQDLYIDYAVLPFTQGKVTATNPSNNTFDVEIDDGFPLLSESHFTTSTEKWGMLKETDGSLKRGVDNLFPYRGWTQLQGNTFRVTQPNASYINQIDIGDYFVQIARNNGKTIFKTNNGKNITYLNITSYASPAGSYSAFNHYEWSIINCKIIPKAGRVHSANADCVHISGSFMGPWIEGCRFEAFSDDAVNMKYAHRKIISIQSTTKLTVLYSLFVGDTVSFYNPREGELLGRVEVTSVSNLGSNNYQITLSDPVNLTIAGDHQSADQAYVDTRSCESFVFRNNTIRNSRRYGMLLQNSYGVVENCLFENLSNIGIRIENGVDWGEGFVANNIEIKNNTFNNCGFDETFMNDETAAAISVRMTKLGTPCDENTTWCGVETAEWQGLNNIRIRNNQYNYNKAALFLQNIKSGELNECDMIHNADDITVLPGVEPTPIVINNCNNIWNQCDDSTDVEDTTNEQITIYPTMVEKNLNFSKAVSRIEIYNLMGVRVLQVEGETMSLDLSFLNSGLYTIVLDGDVKKFIKK
ncbi:hypothetical protein E9993_08660 [Labilibacter sediminis]|nr:hypothetical protein E9993_08660 [Labilibacter sediminis]